MFELLHSLTLRVICSQDDSDIRNSGFRFGFIISDRKCLLREHAILLDLYFTKWNHTINCPL